MDEEWQCANYTTGSGDIVLSAHYYDESIPDWVDYYGGEHGSIMDDGVSINESYDGSTSIPEYDGYGMVNGIWQWIGYE